VESSFDWSAGILPAVRASARGLRRRDVFEKIILADNRNNHFACFDGL
jgi:hypothetical protein